MRQHRAVDALRAENVHVVLLGKLLGRERLGRAKHHVSGVMDHHIDAAAFRDDLIGGGVGGWFRLYVEFDRAQIDAVACGGRGHLGCILRVAAGDVAHRGVYGVPGSRERLGGQAAEAAGRAGDEDDGLFGSRGVGNVCVGHDTIPFSGVRAQGGRCDETGLTSVLRVVVR